MEAKGPGDGQGILSHLPSAHWDLIQAETLTQVIVKEYEAQCDWKSESMETDGAKEVAGDTADLRRP